MQLAVLEFLCGGGLAGETGDGADRHELQSLFQEGFGMLRSMIEDLVACGHSIVTVIDSEALDGRDLASLQSLADVQIFESRNWSGDGFLRHWIEAARKADRALVIAPEIDGELSRITHAMLESDIAVWGATDAFLQHGCDKLSLAAKLPEEAGYPTTWSAQQWQAMAEKESSSLAMLQREGWVLKDRFGAGCADIRYFTDTSALQKFLEGAQGLSAPDPLGGRNCDRWMVQPWIPGIPASLSCIASQESGVKLVGCMGQSIARTESVLYTGGYGPLWEEHHDLLREWVQSIIAPFDGVRGWFGLDVVISQADTIPGATSFHRTRSFHEAPSLGPLEIHLIEINPRLTTSYVGWRELIGPSLAEGVLGLSDAWASCRRTEKQVTFRVPSLP